MSQGNTLIKSTLIYSIGNFGSKILTFLLLPLYSFYLNKEEFGTYDLIIASVTLLVPIITVQISDAIYRWLIDAREKAGERQAIISNGFALITITFFIFLLIYIIILNFLVFSSAGYFAVILFLSCYTPFFQQILRGIGNINSYSIAGIINTLIILLSNIVFLVFFDFGIESLFLSIIIASVIKISYIIFSAKLFNFLSLKWLDISMVKEMLSYSWPLVPNSISWWLINVADKYLILFFLSVEANGIYAISSRFPALITLLNSIFLMAWQDHSVSAKDNSENVKFNSNVFNIFITFELSTVIVLITLSPYLVEFLIDSNFYEAWKYMPLLFVGSAFSAFSAYIGVGYQRAKKTKDIFTTTVIGGLINLTIGLSLISEIGLYAPAVGTLLSFLIIYLIRKKQTNKFFPLHVNKLKLLSLSVLSLTFCYIVTIDIMQLRLVSVISAILLFIFLNRTIIAEGIKIFKVKTNSLLIKNN